MKAKQLSLALVALLAAGGLWLARSAWRTQAFHSSSMGVGPNSPDGPPKPGQMDVGSNSTDGPPNPGQMLRPPVPNRRFTDFTPEQRVEFARKGRGPGG
jgi:hypothetical protein